MKVPMGHPVQRTKELVLQLQRGRALKSMHKSTVEKMAKSQKDTEYKVDPCVGHRTLIMKPDGEMRGKLLKTSL